MSAVVSPTFVYLPASQSNNYTMYVGMALFAMFIICFQYWLTA